MLEGASLPPPKSKRLLVQFGAQARNPRQPVQCQLPVRTGNGRCASQSSF